MAYDEFGREIPDQTPVQMPLGFRRPRPLNEVVQELIRNEMSRLAAAEGQETFDEANDFDVNDDEMPTSRHELLDDEEFHSAEQELLDKAGKEIDNLRALNGERKKENANVRKVPVGDDLEGAGADGKVGAKAGGEGRAAGSGSGGVS